MKKLSRYGIINAIAHTMLGEALFAKSFQWPQIWGFVCHKNKSIYFVEHGMIFIFRFALPSSHVPDMTWMHLLSNVSHTRQINRLILEWMVEIKKDS